MRGERLRPVEIRYITKATTSVPFIAPFLHGLETSGIDVPTGEECFAIFNNMPVDYLDKWLRTQAVRESYGDVTGMTPYLLGKVHSPDELMDVFNPIAQTGIYTLDEEDKKRPGIKKQYLDLILGQAAECDSTVLRLADSIWGKMVADIKAAAEQKDLAPPYNSMTPEAYAFGANTNIALNRLVARQKSRNSRDLVQLDFIHNKYGRLTNLKAGYIVPDIYDETSKLNNIIPPQLRRGYDPSQLTLLEILLVNAGKAGEPFTRALLNFERTKEQGQLTTVMVQNSG